MHGSILIFLVTEKIDTQNEGIPESVAADLDALDRDGVVQGNMGDMQFFNDLLENELLGRYLFFSR